MDFVGIFEQMATHRIMQSLAFIAHGGFVFIKFIVCSIQASNERFKGSQIMRGRHGQKWVHRRVRKRYRKKHLSLSVHVGTVRLQARPVEEQCKYLYRAMRRYLDDVLPLGHRT